MKHAPIIFINIFFATVFCLLMNVPAGESAHLFTRSFIRPEK
jgi:hypothetical protein